VRAAATKCTPKHRRVSGGVSGAKREDTGGMSPRLPAKRPYLPHSPFRDQEPPPDAPVFNVNDRVTHDGRGLGRVVRVSADRMEVVFGDQTVSIALPNPKVHLL